VEDCVELDPMFVAWFEPEEITCTSNNPICVVVEASILTFAALS
jgi:hypothetical protein